MRVFSASDIPDIMSFELYIEFLISQILNSIMFAFGSFYLTSLNTSHFAFAD